jgi:hypothetical protein
MNSNAIGGPLRVRLGSAIFPGEDAGMSFRIKRAEGDLLQQEQANVWEGTLVNWRRVGVIAGTKDRARFFVLEPADAEDELTFESFFVRGKFRVVEKVNNTQRARDAYRPFKAE